jgi:hypothetical protein
MGLNYILVIKNYFLNKFETFCNKLSNKSKLKEIMGKNSLSSKGLSLSQAQSISNLCNQRSREINSKLTTVNNFSRHLQLGTEVYTETVGIPMPSNVVELLLEKAELHSTQAFLMENIKAKDDLIKSIQREVFDYEEKVPYPKREILEVFKAEPHKEEDWAWDQLSSPEYNEYLEAEAFASHVGQFIHKGGVLDKLRTELPTIKTLEWMEVEEGKKTPMKVNIHHNSGELLTLHEELAAHHRKYEQRVNYFKAKVKNLLTSKNSEISRSNAEKQNEINSKNKEIMEAYEKECNLWEGNNSKAVHEFEENRQKRISEIAGMRIDVDGRFQKTIDLFLSSLD